MKAITGLIKLTRINENMGIPIAHTFLALLPILAFEKYQTNVFINILIANTLAVISTFMINDIQDCEKDKFSATKRLRNPISSGTISREIGLVATIIVSVLSLIIYLSSGLLTFLLGVTIILVGYAYSIYWKDKPPLDVLSHIYFLGTGLTLVVLISFKVPLSSLYILPLLISSLISFIVQLNNQIRDFEDDKKANTKTFVHYLSRKYAIIVRNISVMVTLLFIVIYIVMYRDILVISLNQYVL